MRPCSHCGLAVAEEDAICPYCGHSMPPAPPPAAGSSAEAGPEASDALADLDLEILLEEAGRPSPPLDDTAASARLPEPSPPVDDTAASARPAEPDQDIPSAKAAEASPSVEDAATSASLTEYLERSLEEAPLPPPPPDDTAASASLVQASIPEPQPATVVPTAAEPRADTSRAQLAVAAGAGLVIGAVVLMLLFRPTAGSNAPAGTAAPAASRGREAASRPSVSTRPATPASRGAAAPSRWTRSSSKIVEYELPARNEVPVWMTRVRPTLVVRCVSRDTDVLVLMHSAASFEPQAGRHTVRLGFDQAAETQEQWLESDDAQALFAPEGVALARRIASSRAMRFGFTPHNASPVAVDFDVSGFDALIGSVAKACGWKP